MIWTKGKQLQRGRYRIETVLGQGRFGITYLAWDAAQVLVVIKTPNKDALSSEDFERLQEDFVQEAYKLARCRHPHIVEAGEPFKEEGLWCIPMAYIDGVTLDRRAQRQLPESEALGYIQQIGDALGEVHRNGLLHWDVRPANIMVRAGKQEAILIDFGLARTFDHQLTITRTQEISAGFAPIELYSRSAKRGPFTDVYALAATLYELLTGEVPTNAADRKAYNAQLMPPQQHNPLISDAVSKAILRGLGVQPETRPQTVAEWFVSLGIGGASQTPSAMAQGSSGGPDKSWNWSTIWTAVGSFAAVVALLIALPQCQSQTPTPSAPTNPSSTP